VRPIEFAISYRYQKPLNQQEER